MPHALAARHNRLPPLPARMPPSGATLPWVECAPGAPYFVLDDGTPWTPIGANESVTWPELAGLFRRRDLAGVEAHVRALREQGVTVLRLMLEYAQGEHRFFERPAGRYVPAMVRLWDDLFAICERAGMRILLTPYDTFFQWTRWHRHPYNQRHGGPCGSRSRLIVCPETRPFVRQRLAFASERWGGSGALFGWDLWNELHPAQGDYDFDGLYAFVSEVGDELRSLEKRLYGRAHLQTVSVFGPELLTSPQLGPLIFRHPGLDFASTHFYAKGTIDAPRDTVAPAAAAGLLVQQALAEIRDDRPFFESEHGPIHAFKDRHRILPADFDDEYFRHFQWAHLASGGAGGGMRWPNRHPHVLTPGMRQAQRAMATFLPQMDWLRFRRRNLGTELVLRDADGAMLPLVVPQRTTPPGQPPVVELRGCAAAAFACGDAAQALAYLVRVDRLDKSGRVPQDRAPRAVTLELPGLAAGSYCVCECDPGDGRVVRKRHLAHTEGLLNLPALPLVADLLIAVRRDS